MNSMYRIIYLEILSCKGRLTCNKAAHKMISLEYESTGRRIHHSIIFNTPTDIFYKQYGIFRQDDYMEYKNE